MMEISEKLKERFIRDKSLLIKFYDEPFFTEKLHLLEKQFNAYTLWEGYLKMLEKYDSEDDYFRYYNQLKDQILTTVQNAEGFKRLTADNTLDTHIQNVGFRSEHIFHGDNIGKTFLSVDMRRANFNALRRYDASIFNGAETWEDFVRQFTDEEYIIQSKYIREAIFGFCNPNKTQKMMKKLMDGFLTSLLELGVPKELIVYFGNDEVIVDITNNRELVEVVKKAVEQSDLKLRVEEYTITAARNGVNGKILGYILNKTDGTYGFKCFNYRTLPFVLRALQGEEITEHDTYFKYEDDIVKFTDIPQIVFIEKCTW